MMLKGKKILILGGTTQLCDAVLAAKELGLYVIVTDFIEDSPAKRIADKSYLCSINDVEHLTEICVNEKVDGILNLCIDPGQIAYCKVCERLGLPCYGTIEQFEILTNKKKFKKFCMEHGVDVIREYPLDCGDIHGDLEYNLENMEYPVMVKPVDSRGSRGQTECYCKEDVIRAIPIAQEQSGEGGIIAEKLMTGAEDFSVIYMVKDKVPYPVWIGDRYLGTTENKLNKVALASSAPSRHIDTYLEKVNDRVCSMIKALGVVNGPVFFQGFWDGETVRFYDPGFRLPGGQGYRFNKAVYGTDLVKMLIHFSVTGEMSEEYGSLDYDCRLDGKTAVIFSPTLRLGRIKKISGLDKIESHRNVAGVTQVYFEGDCVSEIGNVKSRFGYIHIVCDSKSEAVETVKEIQSLISVLDEDGMEMVFESFAPERIL